MRSRCLKWQSSFRHTSSSCTALPSAARGCGIALVPDLPPPGFGPGTRKGRATPCARPFCLPLQAIASRKSRGSISWGAAISRSSLPRPMSKAPGKAANRAWYPRPFWFWNGAPRRRLEARLLLVSFHRWIPYERLWRGRAPSETAARPFCLPLQAIASRKSRGPISWGAAISRPSLARPMSKAPGRPRTSAWYPRPFWFWNGAPHRRLKARLLLVSFHRWISYERLWRGRAPSETAARPFCLPLQAIVSPNSCGSTRGGCSPFIAP